MLSPLDYREATETDICQGCFAPQRGMPLTESALVAKGQPRGLSNRLPCPWQFSIKDNYCKEKRKLPTFT